MPRSSRIWTKLSISARAKSAWRRRARAMTASVATGPPANTTSGGDVTPRHSGKTSSIAVSLGRFKTMPSAPSSPCSSTSTTVRSKFGSTRGGAATSNRPRSDSGSGTTRILARRIGPTGAAGRAVASPVMSVSSGLLAALRDAVGATHVRTDPDLVEANVVDWTGRFRGATAAVVRPGSVDEVAAVLALCNAAGTAVVPQGGNTGLVGGSVPLHGEIVVDLRRLDAIGPVDARTGQVTAQAGVTLARLQRQRPRRGLAVRRRPRRARRGHGRGHGRDECGRRARVALRADAPPTRRHRSGVGRRPCHPAPRRAREGQLRVTTSPSLVCGSEGTLAVVTAARLRLHAPTRYSVLALCAFDDTDIALDAVGTLRRELDCVNAIELFFDERARPRLRSPRPRAAVRGRARGLRPRRGGGQHGSDRCARPRGGGVRGRGRRRGRDRCRRRPCPVALPRRPSGGHQPARYAAEARRVAACGCARSVHPRRARARGRRSRPTRRCGCSGTPATATCT